MAKVAIIGSGFVGRAWAISFARAGHDIALWDSDPAAPARAISFIDSVLPDLAAHELLAGRSPEDVRARLSGVARIEEAVAGADHVQENTPEDVEVKREVFATLDRLAPPTAVLASSTSAILPSRFTEALAGRARCLVVHPINPPYLIPAAEVVPAPWTSSETVARTRDFLLAAGHAPIVMKRELDGFVMNRMQGASSSTRRSGWSPTAMPASRTSISASARDWRCAGPSWGRSRPSISTRPAASATMSSAIRASTSGCIRASSGGSIGPARCCKRSSATAASGSPPTVCRSGRSGATAG